MAPHTTNDKKSEEDIKNLKPEEDGMDKDSTVAEEEALATNCSKSKVNVDNEENQAEGGQELEVSRNVLLNMIRMGSFCSSMKHDNGDNQDDVFGLAQSITRQKLLELCHFEKSPELDLIERTLIDAKSCPVTPLESTQRESNDGHFRIFQWNLLSQTIGEYSDNFVKCPAQILNWFYRRYSIIIEILQFSPDIICLQEVDHFKFLNKTLITQNYEGVFFPKPDSPCLYLPNNNGPDGCAIFYNKQKFEKLSVKQRVLKVLDIKSKQVAVSLMLKDKFTGQEICVVTTHLKARKGTWLETIRNEQAKDLIAFSKIASEGRPVIICGDFNGDPKEKFYNTMSLNPDVKLESAYARCNKTTTGRNDSTKSMADFEYDYTTWKIRNDGEERRTIDYIFYPPEALDLVAIANIPGEDRIGLDRMPGETYPSDHLSLIADFKYV